MAEPKLRGCYDVHVVRKFLQTLKGKVAYHCLPLNEIVVSVLPEFSSNVSTMKLKC